jgi:DNA-binding transcriptional MerR regulator
MYTLGTAARAAGVSKSTIHRAIKRGTISARSRDAGGYEIDPAELHRVFPPAGTGNGSPNSSEERHATPDGNSGTGRNTVPEQNGSSRSMELRLTRAEAELDALKQIVEVERKRAEELRQERDAWRQQAERLALPAPVPNGEDELRQERDYWREQAERLALPVPALASPARRWWWRRAG